MQTETAYRVTEDAIDLFNHMNYKRYIDLFEKERSNWFTTIGLPFTKMRDEGVAVVILKLETEYLKEARLHDRLLVQTMPNQMGTKSFSLKQVMINEKGEPITTSTCTFVMFDLVERISIPVSEDIKKSFLETLRVNNG